MSVETLPFVGSDRQPSASFRAGLDLFLVSLLLLFLELACIRWFPAHVLFLTFFTNTILLACFLGMSVGCLAASRRQNFLTWTPGILVVALAAAHEIERWVSGRGEFVKVGSQVSPELVFFGTEHQAQYPSHFVVPIEVLEAFFFLIVALALMGPGQEMGRAFNRLANRVVAYTLNILGSIAGIVLFSACSRWEWSPFWWFLLVGLGLIYFLFFSRFSNRRLNLRWDVAAALSGFLVLALVDSELYKQDGKWAVEQFWSPYYRIDYDYAHDRFITVNQISHQQMVSRDDVSSPAYAYALPHLLRRDSGGPPFENVLIIGAGSGNDVSRALEWGVRHVDAVEIDPVILRLGMRDHPDRPYQDSRVAVHLDDGRNFLRSAGRQYDLIVYALVDSLVLHSSYSNIRLESYLFTRQAFEDVRRRLKPDGLFVMYNYFRQGWIVARLHRGLEETFGVEPLVLTLPYQATVRPETRGGFTVFVTGATEALQRAFEIHPAYWLQGGEPPGPESPDGFEPRPGPEEESRWVRFGLARVIDPGNVRTSSDDWPFLYLRRPMIPDLSLRGVLVMGSLSLFLLLLFMPKGSGVHRFWSLNGRMFFLGAGFMLIETSAVVHMALLFGSTWVVNVAVFLAVLVMILAANFYVLKACPKMLAPYYLGLLITLGLGFMIPLDFFLGMNRIVQVIGSCLLVFAPVLFAGVIFAVAFRGSASPDQDFSANVAGAILGGLAENCSMLLGFRYLVVLAMMFYVLSAAALHRIGGEPREGRF